MEAILELPNKKGLTAYANGASAILPAHGDILCWEATGSGSLAYGHVALIDVVTTVGGGNYNVEIVEQNWSTDGRRTLALETVTGGAYHHLRTPTFRGGFVIPHSYSPSTYSCLWHTQDPNTEIEMYPGETGTFTVSYTNEGYILGECRWHEQSGLHRTAIMRRHGKCHE